MKHILRNSLVAVMALFSTAAVADTTIGATDKGWGDACTSSYTLTANQTLTFDFTVDERGTNDWDGYVAILAKENKSDWGKNQYLFLRSLCDYAVAGVWNTGATYNVNSYGTTAIPAFLTGSSVHMSIERRDSEVIVCTDITKNDVSYRHYYVQDLGTTADVYAFLAADGAKLTITNDAITASTSIPSVTGTLHGLADNRGMFGWGNHEDFLLAADGTLNLDFINYSNKTNNWNNWILEIQDGDKFLDLRCDNWGWGAYWDNKASCTQSEGYWDEFINKMDGATVNMSIVRSGSTVTITAKHTPTSGAEFTQTFVNNSFATGDVTVRLLTDGGHLDLLPATTTISEYGWSTYCNSDYALNFAGVEGLTAYMITGYSGNAIETEKVTGTVPAGTPLLLNGTAGQAYNIPIVGSSTTGVADNKLVAGTGAAVAKADGVTRYVLSTVEGKAAFKKIDATAATVAAGKAYLEFTGDVTAPEFFLDGTATGIDATLKNKEMKNEVFFNLAGQRIAQPKKGLYIMNGKKVMVK